MNDSPLIWAEIDLNAIANNVRELRRRTRPQARLMAVVKANGYGHGAAEVARTALANGAEWLGVARLPKPSPCAKPAWPHRCWCSAIRRPPTPAG